MSEDNFQLRQDCRSRRQWGLLGVAGVLSVASVTAGLLTVYAHNFILASCLVIAAIGWTLQFAGASVLGVILWVAAAAMLSVAFWTPISHEDFFVPSSGLFALGGFLLSLPAGILFLLASIKNRTRCASNCAGCMIVVFALVISWVPSSTMRSCRVGPEAVQQTRQLILMLHRLTAEIEAIRVRLGRLPNDEAELVALRGKPMPPYYQDHRVRYMRNYREGYPKADYFLECGVSQFWGHHWDLFPWIFLFHGPNDVQRLQAVAF